MHPVFHVTIFGARVRAHVVTFRLFVFLLGVSFFFRLYLFGGFAESPVEQFSFTGFSIRSVNDVLDLFYTKRLFAFR